MPFYRACVAPFPVILCHALLSAQCCEHHLVMHDSYGDGWNGGHIEVLVNGSSVGVFAATGYMSSQVFTACTGDQIELQYTAADYENENTYQFFGTNGDVIFADGPEPEVGAVSTTTADCGVSPMPGRAPCSALPIDTLVCLDVDNSGVAGTGMDPGCANYLGGDLWYAMEIPPSGNVSVGTAEAGGLNDTGVSLWTGAGCFELTQRACDDDGGNGYYSLTTAYDLPPGEMLYIQVFGYGGAQGAFQLCATDLGTVVLDSSELPIVLINTLGQDIPYDGKVDALMEMKYNGPGTITHVSDLSNQYSGHISIGIRGATSAGYPQEPYSLETRDDTGANNNISLLGMPEENDWVLLSNYNDRSLIRNELAFHLARAMGEYAPRTHLCEVLLDSSYAGIYVFGEKIKRDAGRVDIAKLTGDENTGDDVTGGYILQQNYWNAQNSFQSNWSPIDHPDFDVHFVYEYPEPDSVTGAQRDYIAAYVDSLETALYATDFDDPTAGYRKYLDVPSFINYFLVNEISRNNDGFKKSVFFHKDKYSNGGKMKAGPVWDFDWAWKNLWGCDIFDNIDGSGWAHHINDCPTDNYSAGWYIRLLQDSTFRNELRCVYEEQREGTLSNASISAYIDSVGAVVQNAQARHFQKWPVLGISGPAPEVLACAATYAAELDTLKNWIGTRLAWLDANIPGNCVNTATAEQKAKGTLSCYPNPTTGSVKFTGFPVSGGPWELSVRDVTGREVAHLGPRWDRDAVLLGLPASGTYIYTLHLAEGPRQTGKVVVY